MVEGRETTAGSEGVGSEAGYEFLGRAVDFAADAVAQVLEHGLRVAGIGYDDLPLGRDQSRVNAPLRFKSVDNRDLGVKEYGETRAGCLDPGFTLFSIRVDDANDAHVLAVHQIDAIDKIFSPDAARTIFLDEKEHERFRAGQRSEGHPLAPAGFQRKWGGHLVAELVGRLRHRGGHWMVFLLPKEDILVAVSFLRCLQSLV